MDHKVKYIHIICTDPRIQKFYYNYLVQEDLWGNFDTIQHENPILYFLDKDNAAAMVERIKNYRELHGVDTIVLIDHFDCGAYKLSGCKFSDFEDEVRQHQAVNERAVRLIKEQLQDFKVIVKYIAIDDKDQCSWYDKK